MESISVIIVNFNAGPLLTACVRSVLASTLPVEVIVSDNRSDDSSIAGLRDAFPGESRLRIIENAGNLGFAKANNVALKMAAGDYVLFLNPDCIIRPDTLQNMLNTLKAYPKAGMAGCLIRNPDGSEQAGCRRSVPTPWRTFIRLSRLYHFAPYHPKFQSYVQTGLPLPEAPVAVEAISGAFMLVRRAAIDAVGLMDEGYFMHCEDLDWCMRFRQAGFDILFVPGVEILHVGGVCSASRPISVEYYKHRGMIRFYRKFFRTRYPAVLMWLVLAAVGVRFLLRAATHAFKPDPAFGETPPTPGEASSQWAIDFFAAPPGVAPSRSLIVTGATSLIGDFLLPALLRTGFEVHAISRHPPEGFTHPFLHWHKLDITSDPVSTLPAAEALIHLAPLWTLPPLIAGLSGLGVRRIIAFSSTSIFTKQDSGYAQERRLAQKLTEAERQLADFCAQDGIRWTVFRPTLVYSLGRDKNITTIANFVRRFHFFPLVGAGKGLRQPVHAEDLATACLKVLDHPRTFDKAYNLSGGEMLSYREMVIRIGAMIRKKQAIITIPLPLLRICLRSISYLPFYRHLTPEMANRINRDMCFDHSEASRDFGFQPRQFGAQN
jgi:GT2 family glycosyltransferase/nucleoside-diphosphate-sugar epimerase